MTVAGDPAAAVASMARRIELWLAALRSDINGASQRFKDGADTAADAFLAVLADVLSEHDAAFVRYGAATSAPVQDRFRWFQTIGADLSVLVYYLETLDGALAPRLTPLVAAFERILEKLLPGHPAVFRSFRAFNYELSAIHAEGFQSALGDRVENHGWPALFIKFPTGFLDSPRNHILVAHEVGHAIAAVHRADIERHGRACIKARRAGQAEPPPPAPLWPDPVVPPNRTLEIANTHWAEMGLKPISPTPGANASAEQLVFMEVFARSVEQVQRLVENWMEEIFADAVGGCLFGPAFALSFIDVLVPVSGLENHDDDHPSGAERLLSLDALLKAPEFGSVLGSIPIGIQSRYLAIVAMAVDATSSTSPPIGTSDSERKTIALARELLAANMSALRSSAIAAVNSAGLLYTAQRFKDDLVHVDDMVKLGVPPLPRTAGAHVSLASIFNVAQIVALDRINDFRGDAPPADKERSLDDLILKAVELSEVQIMWEEA